MAFYINYGNDDEELRPLIYCVGNAFPARDRDTYWYYVPALFEGERGYASGDPDWLIAREVDEQGKVLFWAQSSTDISGLEPPCGHYEESLFKKYFARTMREYARMHPESKAKIQELIDQYQLEPGAKADSSIAPKLNPQDKPKSFWRTWFSR